jgi:hypothetical protein
MGRLAENQKPPRGLAGRCRLRGYLHGDVDSGGLAMKCRLGGRGLTGNSRLGVDKRECRVR